MKTAQGGENSRMSLLAAIRSSTYFLPYSLFPHVFFVTGSCYTVKTGFELKSPASTSQVVGLAGMCYHTLLSCKTVMLPGTERSIIVCLMEKLYMSKCKDRHRG